MKVLRGFSVSALKLFGKFCHASCAPAWPTAIVLITEGTAAIPNRIRVVGSAHEGAAGTRRVEVTG